MIYSLATIWHDRQRFLPGVLAVAFSALLIALQYHHKAAPGRLIDRAPK